MKARSLSLIFLLGWGLLSEANATTRVTMRVTGVHQALVQEHTWLNTSRPLTAEDLRGRILLLDFWTFCCINCIHIMPDLKTLEKEFGEDLTVVGVHSAKFENEKDTENIRAAILKYEIEHAVVNDFEFKIWRSFNVRAWPTLLLIHPEGKIYSAYSGEGHLEELRRDIRELIQKHSSQLNRQKLPYALEKSKAPSHVLNFPAKLAFAEDLNQLIVSDSNHHQILGVDPNDGTIVWKAGSGSLGSQDGSFEKASFHRPQGVLYGSGKIFVADTENHLLREIDLKAKTVRTIAGTGIQGFERGIENAVALKTPLSSPWDLAFMGKDGDQILIAMAGTHQLWTYTRSTQKLNTVAGNGREYIDDGIYPANSLSQPSGLSGSVAGKIYFVDSETSSLRVFDEKSREITTLIGTGLFDFGFHDGAKSEALLQHPLGIYADENEVLIADTYNHSIRRYEIRTKKVTTVLGNGTSGFADGSAKQARLSEPNDLLKVGDQLFIADTNNHQIRVFHSKTKELNTLMVHEPRAKSAHQKPASTLPQVKSANKSFEVKSTSEVSISLVLPDGMKVNAQAPSWLAVYDSKSELVKDFSKEQLKSKKIGLPALKEGVYRLQATIYYCREGKESLCHIQSRDEKIVAKKDLKDTLVELHF